jgi:outer membrane lipoprotein-sorting protein
MKTRLVGICLALFCITLSAFADTKTDEIIQASIKASGGKDKFDNVKTTSFDAAMSIPAQSLEFKLSFWLKKPEMMRMVTEIPSMSMKIEAGTDGITYWGTQPGTTTKSVIPAEALNQIKQQLNGLKSILSSPVLDYKEKGMVAAYKGVQDIDEKKCNVIEFTESDGAKLEIFFDAISNLMYSTKTKVEAQGSSFTIEMKIKEYQRVEGMTSPKRIEILQNGEVQQKIAISNIVYNKEMNDADFKAN